MNVDSDEYYDLPPEEYDRRQNEEMERNHRAYTLRLEKELLNLIPDFLILLSFKTIDNTQYCPNGYYLITLKPKEFT